jgi:hypothetical protein
MEPIYGIYNNIKIAIMDLSSQSQIQINTIKVGYAIFKESFSKKLLKNQTNKIIKTDKWFICNLISYLKGTKAISLITGKLFFNI